MRHIAIDPEIPLTRQVTGLRSIEHRIYLYRFFGGDELLYIGVTGWIPERWQRHKNAATWWPLVTSVKVEPFPKMHLALAAERVAIRDESPRSNIRSLHHPLMEESVNAHGVLIAGREEEGKGREGIKNDGEVVIHLQPVPASVAAER